MERGRRVKNLKIRGNRNLISCMVFWNAKQSKVIGAASEIRLLGLEGVGNVPQMSDFLHPRGSRVNANAYFLGCLYLYIFLNFGRELELREKILALFF